jgi:formyltetrahydrofolate deformylase
MRGRLLITCPDRHGIVAAVAGFLADAGANIISSDQHSTDPEGGEFFMRMEFNLEHGELDGFDEIAARFDMEYTLHDTSVPKRMAILVSKEDHCLVDLLWRHRRGELDATIPFVASNHPDWAADVEGFGLPYHHVPFPNEPELIELLRGHCDLVVLAR